MLNRAKVSFFLALRSLQRGNFGSLALTVVIVVSLSWFIGSITFPALNTIYRVNYPAHADGLLFVRADVAVGGAVHVAVCRPLHPALVLGSCFWQP